MPKDKFWMNRNDYLNSIWGSMPEVTELNALMEIAANLHDIAQILAKANGICPPTEDLEGEED